MTPLWTSEEAARATGGRAQGHWKARGVSIDTRTLIPGDLFVALKAERDGHDFVASALERGAAAALVSRIPDGVTPDAPLLLVDDVLPALEDMARAARARFSGKVVAVTGSAGKTGSKEMLRTALGAQARVHAAEKSYNNHWGVPLTLARMPADADYAVIEIGMNAPGEIAPLSRLARPDVSIITTVAAVHLAAFANVEGIAREKASIVQGMDPGGTIILNRDIPTYPTLLRAARRAGVRVVRFGATGRPEYRCLDVRVTGNGTSVSARKGSEKFLYHVSAPGKHLALNALAVLAAIDALGADMGRAALSLSSWTSPEGRGARWNVVMGPGGLDGNILLIDESYNANPAAMEAALDVLASEEPEDGVGRVSRGRRIAFLGDMLELGESEKAIHAALADIPSMASVATVHCAGPLMKALHDALPVARRGEWFSSSEKMAAKTGKLLDAGDIAMVKGSLGSRMGCVVDAVKRMGVAVPANKSEE